MPSSPQWVFGPFRLDPEHACLWRESQAVVLTPKAFAVLHYLVTHPDRLVTKDELLDAVWPETAVSDAVVRVAIGTLRKILDDPAPAPRYIATVPRRGYRFVESVVADTGVVASPAGPVMPAILRTPAVEPSEAPTPPLPDTPVASPHPGGSLLPGALPLPDSERRWLTVLFCDLVDSTRLAGRLDPEDYREIVRAYHQVCAEVIQRFDGYLAQYLGDGVLVYFGYPVAHEDDAQRAVRTGLGLLEAIEPLNTRLALSPEDRVAVRLGVHTGVVVVGDVGAGARQEPLALGETPNIAARLQALAAPNTLVISAATYQLIEGYFTCEALGEQPLRGLAQPLRVYRVLGSSGVQSRLEVAAAHGLTPLVGRTPEVGLLLERWARVKEGMGQVVVLAGEAGIGKSRLVQVLKDHIASEAHTCLECRGLPYYQHTALYPVIDLMQHWLPWQPGAAPGAALGKLEAILAQAQLALAEAVPPVAELIALPLPAERYPALRLTPEQQRQRTFATVLALVEALATQQPVLLIVEDLHWVDPSTLELLTLLLDQVPTLRLYLLLTCRPTFQPSWGFRTHLTPLTLNPLTRSHVEEMVQGMLRGHHLPAAVLAQIVAQTDGIPLFVEEMTKAVVEAGLSTGGPAQDAATRPLPALAIPATLHEALMARLDRLGSAKGVAQLGATIGRQFPYALLRAVAPLQDEPLQRDLATLVTAELLYQRGQPPRAAYIFKHALIQEAAYESVLRSVRRQTHQRILQVLESQFPEMVVTQPVSECFGLPGLASALSRSVLVVSLAECGAFTEGRAPAEEGMQIAEAADHPFSRVMAYWGVGLRALRQGDLPQAIAVLVRALDLAQGAHIRLLVPWVAAPLGAAYALAGRTADALPLLEQAVEQAVAMGFMLHHALRVVCLSEAYLLAGRLDEADTQAQRALEFSQAHQERGHEAYALWLRGEIAAQREPPEPEQAEAHYRQALVLGEELGMRPLAAHCHRGLGMLYRQVGRAQQARASLGTAIELYRTMEMTFWLPQTEAALAQTGERHKR